MVVLTLAALLLRWPLLGPSTLFQDDAWVALVSRADSLQEALRVGPTTPGFSVLLWGVVSLLGFSSVAAQLVPLVAGVATPAVTYALGRSRGFRSAAASVAGALIVLSPTHIEYSARVKQFTIDGLIVAILLLLASRICERPSWARWAALSAASLLAIVTSTIAAVGVAGAFVAAGLATLHRRERRPLLRLLSSAGVVGALSLMWWILVLRPRVSPRLAHYWRARFIGPVDDPVELVRSALEHWAYMSEWFVTLPAGIVGCLVLAGLAILFRRDRITAVLLLVPILVLAMLSIMREAPLGGGRTDLVVYPALALLVAAPLQVAVRWLGRWAPLAVGVVLGAVLVWPGGSATGEPRRPPDGRAPGLLAAGQWPYPEAYPLRDLRPLVGILEEKRRPGDAVFLGSMTMYPFALYTDQPVQISEGNSLAGIALEFGDYEFGPLWRSGDVITPRAEAAERAWVLVGPLKYPMKPGQAQRLRRLGFRPAETFEREDARLVLWTR